METVQDQSDDPRELERKIEQATRIASRAADQTTIERLRAWIEDLKQRLRQRREAKRIKQQIIQRAQEIWEQNGTSLWPRLGVLASGGVRDRQERLGRMPRPACMTHSPLRRATEKFLQSMSAAIVMLHRGAARQANPSGCLCFAAVG